ncbi:unnamed protein product [Enterobius vermicularis]|uniref:Uncharacterized protein n=1 Tax=Enterobius vermicularis TaxID=51028 RepID=A0A0N4V4T4_ENTVE|nr:unnamed protein product [Enterobius vermicularis]
MPLARPLSVTYSQDDLRRNQRKNANNEPKEGNLKDELTKRPLNNNMMLARRSTRDNPRKWTTTYSPTTSKLPIRDEQIMLRKKHELTPVLQPQLRSASQTSAQSTGDLNRKASRTESMTETPQRAAPSARRTKSRKLRNSSKSTEDSHTTSPDWSESSVTLPSFYDSDQYDVSEENEKSITKEPWNKERRPQKSNSVNGNPSDVDSGSGDESVLNLGYPQDTNPDRSKSSLSYASVSHDIVQEPDAESLFARPLTTMSSLSGVSANFLYLPILALISIKNQGED